MKLLLENIQTSDDLSLSGFKLINVFVGRNGCGKTAIFGEIYDAIIDRVCQAKLRCSTKRKETFRNVFSTNEGVKSIDLKVFLKKPLDLFPEVFLIDNFETGLHPSSMYQPIDDLVSFAVKYHTQVFVITYSTECIAALVKACNARLTETSLNDLLSLFRVEFDGKSRKAIHYTGRQIRLAIGRGLTIL